MISPIRFQAARRLLAALFVTVAPIRAQDEAEPFLAEEELPADLAAMLDDLRPDAWRTLGGVSVAWGQRDNPGLGTIDPVSAWFGQTRLEGFVVRETERWDVLGMVDGQMRWYDGHPTVDDDSMWFARGELRGRPWSWLELSATLQGYWQDQVIDLTEDIGVRTVAALQVAGGDAGLGAKVRLPGGLALEGRVREMRADYQGVAEDYLAQELRAELSWSAWSWLTLSAARFEAQRDYDFRGEATVGGRIIQDTMLGYAQVGEEARLKLDFQRGGRWRLEGRLGTFSNRDEASGFYDYDRDFWTLDLSWTRNDWEIRGRFERSDIAYRLQTVGAGLTPDPRTQNDESWEVEVRRQWGEHWELFGTYSRDESLSNDLDSSYTDRTVWAGVGYLF